MGRINYNDADKYQSGSDTEFLKLENDGDMVTVQFLDKTMDDVEVFACHEVDTGGTWQDGNPKTRFVNCLRDYNEPLDNCPFCKAGIKTKAVMMLAMYDHASGKTRIWNRGKTFIPKIANLYNRWGDMTMKPVDIIRNGKKGDKNTTYDVLVSPEQPYDISDVEKPQFLGGYILDKTADEMQYYLDNGDFSDNNSNTEERPTRRVQEPEQQPRSRRRV